MKSKALVAGVSVVVLVAMLVVGFLVGGTERAEAAPNGAALAAPTPVTIYAGSRDPQRIVFLSASTVNTSTAQYSPAKNVQRSEKIDLQAVTTVAASVAHTLTLQFSNDATNWVNGATFVANQNTSQNLMQQYAVFGQYARVKIVTANPTPVAVTVIGLGK